MPCFFMSRRRRRSSRCVATGAAVKTTFDAPEDSGVNSSVTEYIPYYNIFRIGLQGANKLYALSGNYSMVSLPDYRTRYLSDVFRRGAAASLAVRGHDLLQHALEWASLSCGLKKWKLIR